MNSVRFSIAFEVWFEVQTYWVSQRKPCTNRDNVSWTAREDPACPFGWRSTELFHQSELNKICSAEGLTFNLCLSLNHFMVLENIEIEKSHSRNVCIMESVLEQRLQWSSVAI